MIIMIPLSQGKYSIIDGIDVELSDLRWSYSHGYAVRTGRTLNGKKRLHSLTHLHRAVVARKLDRPLLKTEFVDHIDGDKLNNRRENLRIVTTAQNVHNQGKPRNNTSGYKGVSKSGSRWQANIMHNHVSIHLGTFDTPEEAAIAYNEAAIRYRGEYARLNSIHEDALPPSLWEKDA